MAQSNKKWHSEKMAMIAGNKREYAYSDEDRKTLAHTLDENYEPSKPAKPTKAQPGSPDKIRLLRERAEKGQPLWHPDDVIIEHRLHERAEWAGSYVGAKNDPKALNRADFT